MSWKDKIEKFPYIDKIVNFFIGGLLFFVLSTTFSPLFSLIVTACAGLGKEIYDWKMQDWENVDLWDTCCVVLGAVTVALFVFLL